MKVCGHGFQIIFLFANHWWNLRRNKKLGYISRNVRMTSDTFVTERSRGGCTDNCINPCLSFPSHTRTGVMCEMKTGVRTQFEQIRVNNFNITRTEAGPDTILQKWLSCGKLKEVRGRIRSVR